MGSSPHIDAEKYPEQSYTVGHRVTVFFGDLMNAVQFSGTVLRDDKAEPNQTVIRLDDGRIVLGTECNFSVGDRLTCPPKLRGARAIVTRTGYLERRMIAIIDATYECRGKIVVHDDRELTYIEGAMSELKWVFE
jgi:hypothetical protein